MVATPKRQSDGLNTTNVDDRLESLLDEVRSSGPRRVVDREGNVFEIHQVTSAEAEVIDGPGPGESIPDWLRRMLPPGEAIDTDRLRNPERAGLYPVWMWHMWDAPDDPEDGLSSEKRSEPT